MTKEFERAVFDACLAACVELGDDVKKLSCFVNNWGKVSASESETQPVLEQAA